MAIGTRADFVIRQDEYFGGQLEVVAQNLKVFNEASGGAIQLESKLAKGDFTKSSFMKMVAGLISRRDPTSTAGVADAALTQGDQVSPKVNKRFGPIAGTLDEWKKLGETPELFSFYAGKLVAEQKLQNQINTAIMAVAAALQGQANLNSAVAATISHGALVPAMAKLGDRSGDIVCWVMHSKPYHDLIGQAIADKIFGVANVAIFQGNTATLGKPTIVIDAPALVIAGAPNTYPTLGLVSGAVKVTESEAEDIEFQRITGLENLVHRLQGEYAYNLTVKGMGYDTAQGVNPTDAILATPAAWQKIATSDKDLPGVRLVTQ